MKTSCNPCNCGALDGVHIRAYGIKGKEIAWCEKMPSKVFDQIMSDISINAELLEALRYLTKEINLSKLSIRKDFSLINAHASALQAIAKAEGR